MTLDGIRRRAYLPGLGDAQCRMVNYYAIYPNLLLSLHPDYMMTHMLWPRAVDRREIICEWHFHPDEMAKPHFIGDDAVDLGSDQSRGLAHRGTLAGRDQFAGLHFRSVLAARIAAAGVR